MTKASITLKQVASSITINDKGIAQFIIDTGGISVIVDPAKILEIMQPYLDLKSDIGHTHTKDSGTLPDDLVYILPETGKIDPALIPGGSVPTGCLTWDDVTVGQQEPETKKIPTVQYLTEALAGVAPSGDYLTKDIINI